MAEQHVTSLLPPFESKNSLRSLDDCMTVLPAAISCGNQRIRPKRALNEFVQLDLFTPRLDKIYGWQAILLQRDRFTDSDSCVVRSFSPRTQMNT